MNVGELGWRTGNAGRLLYNATDRCVRIKLRHVHEVGFGDVSEAQLSLYQNMDAGGTRLTTLAARTGLTKPSITELVTRGEKQALVARHSDPGDARAKIVSFTARGEVMMTALRTGMGAVEEDIGAILGPAVVADLKTNLIRFIATAEQSETWSEQSDDPQASWRADTIGRLLALSARGFARRVLWHLRANGHDGITEALLALFRNLDLEGTRLTDLAMRARMTKQSMREQVDRAAAMGLVERLSDSRDSRAKYIVMTPRGLASLDAMRAGVEAAEQHMRASIGARAFDRLKAALRAIDRAASSPFASAA